VYYPGDFDACTIPSNTPTFPAWQNCIEASLPGCMPVSQKVQQQVGNAAVSIINADLAALPNVVETSAGSPGLDIDAIKGSVSVEQNVTACSHDGYFDVANPESKGGYDRTLVNEVHSQLHVRMGSGGDLEDVTTSPNDGALFVAHHNNVDRSNFIWMHNIFQSGSTDLGFPAHNDDFSVVRGKGPWGISGPYSQYCLLACGIEILGINASFDEYAYTDHVWIKGTTYNEVVHRGWPFYDLFGECNEDDQRADSLAAGTTCSGGSTGYTHGQVIEHSTPDATTYTYDTLEEYYAL